MKKGDIITLWWCEECGLYLTAPMLGVHTSGHTVDRLKLKVIE